MPNLISNERSSSLYSQRLFIGLLFYILASTLVTSKLFIYPSLTPLFLYLAGISVLIISSGYILNTTQTKISLEVSLPVIVIALWDFYILLNSLINHNFNLFHTYLLFNCCLFFVLIFLFGIYQNYYKAAFTIITILALTECCICFGQYVKIFNSLNSYFPITGSWENPNVTAMFLTMTVPAVYGLLHFYDGYVKNAVTAIIVIIIVTILLLQCRTAIIGVIVALFVISFHKFKLVDKLRSTTNRSLIILVTLLSIGAVIPIAKQAYSAKQGSADGRKLIWKLSGQIIANNPFIGYGYGTFEHQYNLQQAEYFKKGNGTDGELKNAAFIHMGYNELLQNGVEGGIAGAILLLMIFFILLRTPVFERRGKSTVNLKSKEKENQHFIIAYASVAAFAAMSMFNFSLQAIPVLCLFVLYSAILAGHPDLKLYKIPGHTFFERSLNRNNSVRYIRLGTGIVIVIFGLLIGLQNTQIACYNYLNKQARKEADKYNYTNALRLMSSIGDHLNNDESYWTNYGNIFFAEKNFAAALIKYNQAILLTSDPAIYSKLAQCYIRTGDYSNAEKAFLIAKYIEPSRIAPRFALMNLYLKMNDTIKTVSEARDIVKLTPKISSQKASNYKYQAMMLMTKLNHPYQPFR